MSRTLRFEVLVPFDGIFPDGNRIEAARLDLVRSQVETHVLHTVLVTTVRSERRRYLLSEGCHGGLEMLEQSR
jgi:hypothetical protein